MDAVGLVFVLADAVPDFGNGEAVCGEFEEERTVEEACDE